MPRYLLKPKSDVDFYVDWSTVVDDAVAWGPRDYMVEIGYSEERLDRCDVYGTSAFWFRRNFETEEHDKGVVLIQYGVLPYAKMEDFFTEVEKLYPEGEEIPEDIIDEHPELMSYIIPIVDEV